MKHNITILIKQDAFYRCAQTDSPNLPSGKLNSFRFLYVKKSDLTGFSHHRDTKIELPPYGSLSVCDDALLQSCCCGSDTEKISRFRPFRFLSNVLHFAIPKILKTKSWTTLARYLTRCWSACSSLISSFHYFTRTAHCLVPFHRKYVDCWILLCVDGSHSSARSWRHTHSNCPVRCSGTALIN